MLLAHPSGAPRARHAPRAVTQVSDDRQVGEQPRLLEHHADAPVTGIQ